MSVSCVRKKPKIQTIEDKKYVVSVKKNKGKTWKYLQPTEKIIKFNKRRACNKDVGPGKKSEMIKHRVYVYSGL